MTSVLALTLLAAVAYGFTGAVPRLDWLYSRPVRGAALVCLGVAAVFVPLAFVIAALLIGAGTRMVWASACEVVDQAAAIEVDAVNRGTVIVEAEVVGRDISPVPRAKHTEI